MEPTPKPVIGRFWLVIIYILFVIAVLFVVLVISRIFHSNEVEKTKAVVAKIHATKLTLDDVMGKNLPPDPGAEADKTIAGVDVNKNGIRDDVELAIFKDYPNSAKTRAVLLQYALALQMEFTQTIVNTGTVDAVANYGSRSDACLADTLVPRKTPESSRDYSDIEKIDTYIKYVTNYQINNEERKKAHHSFYEGNLRGYDNTDAPACDLNISLLSND